MTRQAKLSLMKAKSLLIPVTKNKASQVIRPRTLLKPELVSTRKKLGTHKHEHVT